MSDRVLNERSVLRCDHESGSVVLSEKQDFVFMETQAGVAPLLVDPTLNNAPVLGCLWAFTQGQQCKTAAPLGPAHGRSNLVFVMGRPVLLDSVRGGTNSNPPAAYTCKSPVHAYLFSSD